MGGEGGAPGMERRQSYSGREGSKLSMELTEEDWNLFLSGAKQRKYRKGDYVLQEGHPTSALYQILQGALRVELQLKDQPQAVVVGHRGAGEMFGETSLLKAGRMPPTPTPTRPTPPPPRTLAAAAYHRPAFRVTIRCSPAPPPTCAPGEQRHRLDRHRLGRGDRGLHRGLVPRRSLQDAPGAAGPLLRLPRLLPGAPAALAHRPDDQGPARGGGAEPGQGLDRGHLLQPGLHGHLPQVHDAHRRRGAREPRQVRHVARHVRVLHGRAGLQVGARAAGAPAPRAHLSARSPVVGAP